MKKDKYKLEGRRITLTGRSCPKCGGGVFMAEHKDRLHCGKCGFTEWKEQKPSGETAQPVEGKVAKTPAQGSEAPSEEKPADAPPEEKKEEGKE